MTTTYQEDNKVAVDQFDHLKLGRLLKVEELVTIRNIFHFCLENKSPNGCRPMDIAAKANPQVVHSTKIAWPYDATNDLATMLVWRKDEPPHFFYTICKLRVQH
ncbi:hypothetical protein J1N35_040802, partial [Gossypium stocksii]